jgi:hypothetical protein
MLTAKRKRTYLPNYRTKVFLIIVEIFGNLYSEIYRAKTRRKFRISITLQSASRNERNTDALRIELESNLRNSMEEFFPFSGLAHFWETKDTYKWFVVEPMPA